MRRGDLFVATDGAYFYARKRHTGPMLIVPTHEATEYIPNDESWDKRDWVMFFDFMETKLEEEPC